jgi:hypothetical protein
LVVRTSDGEQLSFVLRGKEVEFLAVHRLQAVGLCPERPGEAHLELRGAFQGATAYGADPSRRLIGPLPMADARAAVADLERTLDLPKPIHSVTLAELESDPQRYSGQWIEVVVRWSRGFEASGCGERLSIWLDPAQQSSMGDFQRPDRNQRRQLYRIVGRFDYAPRSAGGTGFGHMGASSAGLRASSMELLPDASAE